MLRLSSVVREEAYSIVSKTQGNSLQGTSLPHLIVINCYKISETLKSVHSMTKKKEKKEIKSENRGVGLELKITTK